jgi:hypothetical protein
MIGVMWNWDYVGRMWSWPNYSSVLEFYRYFLLITDRLCINSLKPFEDQQCGSTVPSNTLRFPKEFFFIKALTLGPFVHQKGAA